MTMLPRAGLLVSALLCAALVGTPARAQTTPGRALESASPFLFAPPLQSPTRQQEQNGGASLQAGTGRLILSASYGGPSTAVVSGIRWRVYQQNAENGVHALIAESTEVAPALILPDGDYVVHAAYGLAAAMRRVTINSNIVSEKIALNAGALRILGLLGDAQLQPNRLKIDIYVPERTGQPEKLVAANVRAGDMVRLPEGSYRIVSTYLDLNVSPSAAPTIAGLPANATNSVINAEVRIEAGKLSEAAVRHRASNITLKLVNSPGGDALANTSFTVLTPGGDVIREMIGAFPRLVLAEGEYFVIARRDGKTHQMTIKVPSNSDREIEIMAKASGG